MYYQVRVGKEISSRGLGTHLNDIHQDYQIVVFQIHRVLGSYHIGHGFDDDVPVELFIAPHSGSNGVLASRPDQSCPDNSKTRVARGLTFFGGPPEWKCGLRMSFAKASRSTLSVFLISVIGVMRLMYRLFFMSG